MRTWVNPYISVKFRYFWNLMEYQKNMWYVSEEHKMYFARFIIGYLNHDKDSIFPMKEQAYAESDIRDYDKMARRRSRKTNDRGDR